MAKNKDIVLKIRVLDAQESFLGGTVDIRLEHLRLKKELRELRDVDASREIDVRGLRRGPEGLYKVFVTVTDPWNQQGKFVNIPSSGFATLDFVFEGADEPAGQFEVRGLLRYANGMAAPDFQVRAFDRDLRSEELLGEARTDEAGRYEIRYTAEQFRRAEKATADLLVRAFDVDDREVAASPVLFNAGPVETINLVVGDEEYRGPSEYEQLVAELTPLLQNLSFAELTEDDEHRDVTFLSSETDQDPGRITFLITAHRLFEATDVPAEVFYGLFRQGLPTELPELLAQSSDVQRRALVRSAQDNVIPPAFADRADAIGKDLKELVVRQALEQSGDGRATLNELLSVTLEDGELRQEFLNAYVHHTGPVEELWKSLATHPNLGEHVDDIQRILQLGALTGSHLPLVHELLGMRLADLSELARFDEAGWLEIISKGTVAAPIGVPPGVPGEDDEARAHNYARALSYMVEDAFPTPFVARRLETDDLAGKDDLVAFFSANAEYDVRSTRLTGYLQEHPDAFANVQDPEATRGRLQALQRVYKLAPRYRQASALIRGGVDSAHAVARMGENVFVSTYADAFGGTREARRVYARAQQVQTMALHLAGEYGLAGYRVNMHAVPDDAPAAGSSEERRLAPSAGSALRASESALEVPDWASLFGSVELCRCEHCRSVYSPAAYLVDVLHFLSDRRSKIAGKSAKDILFERRPDLGEIELTCQNTNLPLPYVDLVNEVLENAVAPSPAFAPQTEGSAAERAANPQYVNAAAYDVLAEAVYPWSLPFHLWTEEARAYLGHLGVPRYRIMESFQAGERAAILDEAALAREHLGLTTAAADLVTGVITSGPWNLWGFPAESLSAQSSIPDPSDSTRRITGGNWLEVLSGRVDVFLRQSGLSYKEMLDLLGTYFVNPLVGDTRAIRIVSTDADNPNTCETDKLSLYGLDESAAARGVRFVRLWRVLDWSLRDLDRAVTAFAPADLDDDFLTRLSHVKRLHTALGVSVVRLLSWWADIDAGFYIDHETSGQPRAASLYDELFRNRTVVDPPDPAFTEDPADLPGDDPQNPKTLTGHVAAITAALGISAADFALLLADANVIPRVAENSNDPEDVLSLKHLSRLHRHASLAKALRLPVRDYLATLSLITPDPFGTTTGKTTATLIYVEKVDKVRDSGFTVAELDYLLRHRSRPEAPVAPGDEAVGTFLDDLRAGLQKIVEENAFRADPADPAGATTDLDGELTRRKLALLDWEPAWIDQSVATLNGAVVYEAPLDPLPDKVATFFEENGELRDEISYDVDRKVLRFTGPMANDRKVQLDDISGDQAYLAAVEALYRAPRDFLDRVVRTFAVHDFATDLEALPAGFELPSFFRSKVYFDSAAERLHCVGVMSPEERDALLDLSADAAYQAAIADLFNQPEALVPAEADQFLIAADAALLFDTAVAPGDRFLFVLAKLLPYLRRTLNERFAVQKMAEALQLETRTADELLRTWLASPVDPQRSCLDELLDPAFAESNTNVELTAAAFPAQFKTFLRVHKAAMVASGCELTHRQLGWLFTYGPGAGWLDLNALPVDAQQPAADFDGWLRLAELAGVRDGLPQGEKALDEVLAGKSKETWLAAVGRWTEWSRDDLETLLGPPADPTPSGLFKAAFPDDYAGTRLLARLRQAFGLLKRLGLPAAQADELAADDVTEAAARGVRQAVRAKYDEAQWLNLAKPLRDVLREQQRAALVAYLVVHLELAHNVRDANDLYAHFLLDVEMAPCMMTSRTKQALSSVQLFAQRCLMNLEPDVAASAAVDEKWREWEWMKNYRVWEANRKIFLYAENWIEPELRDDKSPFFAELESELLQSDLTMETAEEAFRHYLEKLDQVAQLQVVAVHHQLEEDDAGNTAVDVLHVFAHTSGKPYVYYYRQRVDSADWTAWERLDLDIEGEHEEVHLVPVVWNRRLRLFWPIFTKKAYSLNVELKEGNLSGTESSEYWEIKLAWSERKPGKWTPKRVSTAPAEIPSLPGRTDDPAGFLFRTVVDGENNLLVLVLRRWILGSGVFRPLLPAFRFDGCQAEPSITRVRRDIVSPGAVRSVTGTIFDGMFLRESSGEDRLYLPAPTDTPALARTPGTFLLVPHADGSSITRNPFFYRDDRRTFFVIPSQLKVHAQNLLGTTYQMNLGWLDNFPRRYWHQVLPFPDRVGPIVKPEDPPIFDQTFPVIPDRSVNVMQARGGVILPSETDAILTVGPRPAGAPLAMLPLAARRASGGDLAMEPGFAATFTTRWYLYRTENRFLFQTFYHPYVCAFVRELNRNGVHGLLQRRVQMSPDDFALRKPDGQPVAALDFKTDYGPHEVTDPIVLDSYPSEDVDFEDGSYALYNWELFFHAPLMIADRLSKNQRYEEAQRWFHFLFDPTDTSGLEVPQRYWRTKPFHKRTREGYRRERIRYILKLLAAGADPQAKARLSADERGDLERFEKGVAAWRKDPFKPHLIARLRTTAYQKAVVMKYLDNVIAWADHLFRRDTIESINEAAQLYILAAEILGRRPQEVPPRATPPVETYNSLEPRLDDFSGALVQIEDFVSPSANVPGGVESGRQPALTLPAMLYFCIPKNDKLLAYWDTVADRLFKIRHCMNIEGVVRQLPLFEPPIEPGLLVRAAAAGVDFGSVLDDVSAAPSHYRFNVLAQKATEVCAELKGLGQAMLSALEKRDAEHLSLLRAEHEASLLDLVEQVRVLQLDEAEQNKTALEKSRETTVARYLHYQKLLGVQEPKAPEIVQEGQPSEHVAIQEEGGVKMIVHEKEEMAQRGRAQSDQSAASGFEFMANAAYYIPTTVAALWGVGVEFGGKHLGPALKAIADRFRADSAAHAYRANRAGTLARYALRAHDWLLQSNLAAREIMQIDQQIVAAQLRIKIADSELTNHRGQMAHAREVEDYLSDKYTSEALYGWMIGQLATVYFQTYQLAYDLAKRAERAYRHELGLKESSFIHFGYWDSLKKGLLAGERLFHDLKRMEVAYLEKNRREFELSKHVSLNRLDPLALIRLRQTGTATFNLPEALFDLDCAGHTMRRIKSVGLSIPCVTGPHTGVHCTLTLLKSSVRHGNTLLNGSYARQEGDPRFTDYLGTIQSIVTSGSQNDSGLFDPNLRDERYLPFEGAGAISEWRIELPADFRQFDYDTISDVVLHLRYTAREGGGLLKQQATLELQTALDEFLRSEGQHGLAQLFSLRHEFPNQWHRFLNPPPDAAEDQKLTMPLIVGRFPFFIQGKTITIDKMELFVKVDPEFSDNYHKGTLKLSLEAGTSASANPVDLNLWNGLLSGEKSPAGSPGDWTLTGWLDTGGGQHQRLEPGAIQDILLVSHYKCT